MILGKLRSFALGLVILATSGLFQQEAWTAEPSAPAAGVIQITYRGLVLSAAPGRPDKTYDTSLLTPEQAIENLKRAIDLVLTKSTFSTEALKTLQDNGRVVIVYSPDFRAARNGLFTLAAFSPDYYKRDDPKGRKDFLVIVGQHAVKWPPQELAMILVHELVGHGIQHYKGWLDFVREIDLECNANLYGERFYQDIGIDKQSEEVVKFRKSLETHWCADFKVYIKEATPADLPLWDKLNPDVPKLLTIFDRYTASLKQSGVADRAIQAARGQARREIDEGVRREAMAGKADAEYRLGLMYRDGIGVEKNPTEGASWLLKAARQGHAEAQTEMGVIYANGTGVKRDLPEALSWLDQSAANGDPRAKPLADKIREILAGMGSVR